VFQWSSRKLYAYVAKSSTYGVYRGKNSEEAVYRYFLSYRATPHSATGRTPAELLFNRRIATTISFLKKNEQDREMREREGKYKEEMAIYIRQVEACERNRARSRGSGTPTTNEDNC